MSKDARALSEANTQQRSQLLGLRYVDVRTLANRPLYGDILSVNEMKEEKVFPLVSDKDGITFAIITNTSPKVKNSLRNRFSEKRVEYVLVSDEAYHEYINLYDPPKKVEYHDIELSQTTNEDSLSEISQTLLEVKPDDMLAFIVKQAFRLRASDIHLESEEDHVRLRFRVHGVLHPVANLTLDRYRLLLSTIASAANISTNVPYAQTGHIGKRYTMEDKSEVMVNLRIETVQTVHKMDVVMRLFNFNAEMLNLDHLGLDTYERSIIDSIITKPTGLMMIVGPTGSGKSTTLYSMINQLRGPEHKIITLEDPVEFQIPGVTQIPIDTQTGASFAEALRAVLRLDPDVVMVGEIRDNDTAKTALQAALSGHLVLTTYHASSAAAAMTRILDAVDANPLFLSAIRAIQAQRLVRHLDQDTKVPYTPDAALTKLVTDVVNTLPAGHDRPDLTNITLYRPGKSEANPFGFDDQVALREFLLMSDELLDFIKRDTEVTTADEIQKVAVEKGAMKTMLQDGVLKALAGQTTIEEVYRVV